MGVKFDRILDGFDGPFEAGGCPTRPRSRPSTARTLGNVTVAKTVPQLRAFLENGGTVVTIGGSTALARHLGLPVTDYAGGARAGRHRAAPAEREVLHPRLDPAGGGGPDDLPAAWGMEDHADVMFDESPCSAWASGAAAGGAPHCLVRHGARRCAAGGRGGSGTWRTASPRPRRRGAGKLFLFGPEITFRAQPHGTFRFLFNGLYASVMQPAR
jgi:hypothetical protein